MVIATKAITTAKSDTSDDWHKTDGTLNNKGTKLYNRTLNYLEAEMANKSFAEIRDYLIDAFPDDYRGAKDVSGNYGARVINNRDILSVCVDLVKNNKVVI